MAQLPSEILTHSQKVCRLYKRALLALADWIHDPLEYRYQAVKMRKRFDDNACIKDLRLAKHLLIEGEEEYEKKQHCQPFRFPDAPGGTAYAREALMHDSILDSWDPIEKSLYPKYFARRAELKKEFIEFYYKQHPEKKLEHQKIDSEQLEH